MSAAGTGRPARPRRARLARPGAAAVAGARRGRGRPAGGRPGAGRPQRSSPRGPKGAVVVDGVVHRPRRGGRILVLGRGQGERRASPPRWRRCSATPSPRVSWSPRRRRPTELRRIELLTAGHPVPTPASRRAALRLMRLAETAGPGDVVLACFTGGSSALASPAGARRPVRGEARPAPAAAGLGRPDPRHQHRAQARLALQGRPPRRGRGRTPRSST